MGSTPTSPAEAPVYTTASAVAPRQRQGMRVAVGLYVVATALVLLAWPGHAGIALACGLALLGYELDAWLRRLGEPVDLTLPFRALALTTMWVGPALSGVGGAAGWPGVDVLPIALEQYFWLAVPGTMALNLALRLHVRNDVFTWIDRQWTWARPDEKLLLAVIAVAAIGGTLLTPFAGGWLRQPVFLLAQLVYPALLLAMSVWPGRRWWLVATGIGYALAMALRTTYFGEVLFWSMLLGWHASAGARWPVWRRYALLGVSMGLLLLLLSVKYDYRRILSQRPMTAAEQVMALGGLVGERLRRPAQLWQPDVVSTVINRFNQGYFTSRVQAHVPHQEPWAYGGTLWRDLRGALLPRWLDPGKPRAGGHANMLRFTGWDIGEKSYNIGFYGEAYVNFGLAGAWLWLAAYGLLFVVLQALVRRIGVVWVPYLLLPAIQVETDFGIAFNHFVKAGVVLAVLFLLTAGITRLRQIRLST